MKIIRTDIDELVLIKPDVFEDSRGFFLESYSQKKFEDAGISCHFVQDNHSRSEQQGVIRGLHFQKPPFAQSKLIRVTRGAIFDVAVDLRKSSPTFGMWKGFELTDKNYLILFVPQGFAHGFCTLCPGTEVQYKVDNLYAPDYDSGIRWNDPLLAVNWPVKEPVLSKKDAILPFFKELKSPF
ncbi:MAG TPA: dTDP-4-dehydrorhamnose 3,5-epimerase [Chitinispirillaceae bacterium]|nr:dTDP-4-dehydrorhamnose 3,5-epimerase [Chitinispirillaceae bacterium]